MVKRVGLVLAVLASTSTGAWPADVYVDLQSGKEEFRKLTAIAWAEVEDPEIAQAEVLPSGELLLTGRAPGRTLVLLYAEGKFAVWRVRVGKEGERAVVVSGDVELEAAKKACRKLEVAKEALAVVVPDEACRKALVALFQTDRFSARDLELTFELPALQGQLAEIQKGLGAAKVSYRGAGLVLEGRFSPEEHRKVLWELFRRSAGRVPLDDRSEVSVPDAGTAD